MAPGCLMEGLSLPNCKSKFWHTFDRTPGSLALVGVVCSRARHVCSHGSMGVVRQETGRIGKLWLTDVVRTTKSNIHALCYTLTVYLWVRVRARSSDYCEGVHFGAAPRQTCCCRSFRWGVAGA